MVPAVLSTRVRFTATVISCDCRSLGDKKGNRHVDILKKTDIIFLYSLEVSSLEDVFTRYYATVSLVETVSNSEGINP